jgi:hypothetical protein
MSSYIPIASQTLASSASSVTFSSIPTELDGKTLRDLVLVMQPKRIGSEGNWRITFNGDTNYNDNYFGVTMWGTGSSSGSSLPSGNNYKLNLDPQNYGDTYMYLTSILDFAATDKHKTFLNRMNDGNTQVLAGAYRWANTSAITTLKLHFFSDSLINSGSTFSLYGIEG